MRWTIIFVHCRYCPGIPVQFDRPLVMFTLYIMRVLGSAVLDPSSGFAGSKYIHDDPSFCTFSEPRSSLLPFPDDRP
jgi:hypothetical protein